jgi:protein-disulfide isomerase
MSVQDGSARLTLPVGDRDHIQGSAEAPLTLVEYGDYECPYCGMAHPIVKEVQRRLGDQLRFVFRNFPLTNVHPHAAHAAEAAEAAAMQGTFWDMHDVLFERQRTLDDDHLRQFAKELGLDVQRFDRDMMEHHPAERVREDFMSGVRSGVNGTPTFFINGVRHDGSYNLDVLLHALEAAARRHAAIRR